MESLLPRLKDPGQQQIVCAELRQSARSEEVRERLGSELGKELFVALEAILADAIKPDSTDLARKAKGDCIAAIANLVADSDTNRHHAIDALLHIALMSALRTCDPDTSHFVLIALANLTLDCPDSEAALIEAQFAESVVAYLCHMSSHPLTDTTPLTALDKFLSSLSSAPALSALVDAGAISHIALLSPQSSALSPDEVLEIACAIARVANVFPRVVCLLSEGGPAVYTRLADAIQPDLDTDACEDALGLLEQFLTPDTDSDAVQQDTDFPPSALAPLHSVATTSLTAVVRMLSVPDPLDRPTTLKALRVASAIALSARVELCDEIQAALSDTLSTLLQDPVALADAGVGMKGRLEVARQVLVVLSGVSSSAERVARIPEPIVRAVAKILKHPDTSAVHRETLQNTIVVGRNLALSGHAQTLVQSGVVAALLTHASTPGTAAPTATLTSASARILLQRAAPDVSPDLLGSPELALAVAKTDPKYLPPLARVEVCRCLSLILAKRPDIPRQLSRDREDGLAVAGCVAFLLMAQHAELWEEAIGAIEQLLEEPGEGGASAEEMGGLITLKDGPTIKERLTELAVRNTKAAQLLEKLQ